MTSDFVPCYQAVCEWAAVHGIAIKEEALPPGKAGEFTGRLVTMNHEYGAEERLYYLIHALGSIVLWSSNKAGVEQMFNDLRDAKSEKAHNPSRLETAIVSYRRFEVEASEHAVWLLGQLGQGEKVPSYTNFMWADLEAMTEFHRTGKAPVWCEFFDRWNHDVASGRRPVRPFNSKPIPHFQPVLTERQEILQRQPGANESPAD